MADGIGNPGVSDIPLHDLDVDNVTVGAGGKIAGSFYLGKPEPQGMAIAAKVYVGTAADIGGHFRPELASDTTDIWKDTGAVCKVTAPNTNVTGAQVSFTGNFPLTATNFWVAVELSGDDPDASGSKEKSFVSNAFPKDQALIRRGQKSLKFKPFKVPFHLRHFWAGTPGSGDDVIPITIMNRFGGFDNRENHFVYTNQPNQTVTFKILTNDDPVANDVSVTSKWTSAGTPKTDASSDRAHGVHLDKKVVGLGFKSFNHLMIFTFGAPPGSTYPEWSGVIRSSDHP